MPAEPFPRAPRLRRGYDRRQVTDFVGRARREWDAGGPPGEISAWHIRNVGFDLRHAGYDIAAVDVALDRIEDAYTSREDRADRTASREAEAVVRTRLADGRGHRFPRAQGLSLAYRRSDVDKLLDRVREHLDWGRPLNADEVRNAVFRSARGRAGYREAPVDAYLDRVVAVLRTRKAPR